MRKEVLVICVCLFLLAGCGQSGEDDRQDSTRNSSAENTSQTLAWEGDLEVTEVPIEAISAQSAQIPAEIMEGKEKHLSLYSADMNHDGQNEYVIAYSPENSEDMINIVIYNPVDNSETSIFTVVNNSVSYTELQKSQINDIIEVWYDNGFLEARQIEKEVFEKYNIGSFYAYPVMYDGTEMLHVVAQLTEQLNTGFMSNDKIEAYITFNDETYEIYKFWYNAEYKYIKTFDK